MISPQEVDENSLASDWIPTGIDKRNKKIMIVTIVDPDLFQVKN
jgi:hypothetical protein